MSNKNKGIIGLFIICIFAAYPLIAGSDTQSNPVKGERLFKQSQCLSCHGTDIFTRKNRVVKNLNALEKKVRRCDSELDIHWFDDEIRHVVSYLNKTYYKFSTIEQPTN